MKNCECYDCEKCEFNKGFSSWPYNTLPCGEHGTCLWEDDDDDDDED